MKRIKQSDTKWSADSFFFFLHNLCFGFDPFFIMFAREFLVVRLWPCATSIIIIVAKKMTCLKPSAVNKLIIDRIYFILYCK